MYFVLMALLRVGFEKEALVFYNIAFFVDPTLLKPPTVLSKVVWRVTPSMPVYLWGSF